MGVNSLPKTVTRQRRKCDLNPGPSAPESSTLTTRLPSHLKSQDICMMGLTFPRWIPLVHPCWRWTLNLCSPSHSISAALVCNRKSSLVCNLYIYIYIYKYADNLTHNKLGDRSFSAAGPQLWNDLPPGLRRPGLTFDSFRPALKSHLFGDQSA